MACVVMRFSGSDVVYSQPNENGQACATIFGRFNFLAFVHASSLFDILPHLTLVHFCRQVQ